MSYPPGSGEKNARFKQAAKIGLKKFGPLIITGLAAVAEHHWLKRDDEKDKERGSDDRDERSSIQELKDQVSKLKRSLKRKGKGKKKDDDTTSDSSSASSPVHKRRTPFREGRPPPMMPMDRGFDDGGPTTYFTHYVDQAPEAQRPYQPPVFNPSLSGDPEPRNQTRNITTRQRHHHRHSLPNRLPLEEEFSGQAIHAGKIAVVAGALEAIHVSDVRGDWIGPKGVRVGTAMAASFGATYSRDRDPDHTNGVEVIADVGTGLLVNRLVLGSSRRIEEDRRGTKRERRWSHVY